jgi:predicted nucleotidyltransferase
VDRSARDREQIVGEFRRELEASPEVVVAFLQESFSTGGTFRDIDVAVWLAPDRLSRDERFRYALDLSVHLHVQLRCQVDVRVLNDAPLGFRFHAFQGRPLVTRDDEFLDDLRARTLGRLPRLSAVCPAVIRDDLGDLERYPASVGRYLKAEL